MNIKLKKSTLILLGVLVILLVGFLIYQNIDLSGIKTKEWQAIDQDKIDKMELTYMGQTITFKKSKDEWRIMPEGYLASKTWAESIVPLFSQQRKFELISNYPSYSRYGLEGKNLREIKVYADNKQVRHLYLGNFSSKGSQNYVRFPDDKKIYQTTDNLTTKFYDNKDRYREKTIYETNVPDITSVHFTFMDNDKVKLTKKEVEAESSEDGDEAKKEKKEIWVNEAGEEVDKKDLLQTLQRIQATEFLTQSIEELKKEDKMMEIAVYTKDGSEILLTFLKNKRENNRYWAYSNMRDESFAVSSYKTERLIKNFQSILGIK